MFNPKIKAVLKILCLGSLLCAPVACTVHHVDIQQGNYLSEETLNQLQLGMDKRQVKYILGSPLITDSFHTNRWDYTYYLKQGHKKPLLTGFTLFFDDEKLVKIEKEQFKSIPNQSAS